MKFLIDYKDLILYKAAADLRSEARRYYISYLWWILEPIMEMMVFYLVFGVILKKSVPNYLPFLFIGLTAWKWFNTTIQHGANSIINSSNLIQQVNLDKIVFPLIVILTDSFKFIIVMALTIVFCLFYGLPLNVSYIYLPLVMVTELLVVTAVSLYCAAVTPFFPDITIFINNIFRLVFFLSGIFFDGRSLSPKIQTLFYLNPIALVIESYRDIIMYANRPDLTGLTVISIVSILNIYLGRRLLLHFDKKYPRLAER